MTPGNVRDRIAQRWAGDVLPSLSDLVAIPAVSPAYDAGWRSRGALHSAAAHMAAWITRFGVRAEVVELPGRSPLVVAEVPATPGASGRGTALLYGHLDKQPQDGPWQSAIRDGRLHGRGSADDGYAGYAALTALAVAGEHGRAVVLLETGEESGSPDLAAYLDHLDDRLGHVSLVVCLGAVVRASTSLRLSFRLPPTADPEAGYEALARALTTQVPYDAEVTVGGRMTIAGWDTPPVAPWLSAALDELGRQIFDRPCGAVAGGGGIPSVELLGRRCPDAQFVVTGAAGPDSNIHGPGESLDLAHARRITEAVARLLAAHARH